MSILSDIEIKERVYSQNMISPYVEKLVKENINGERIISYGQSSYGYDIRCSNVFDIFTNINYTKINPKKFDDRSLIRHVSDDSILIPPNSFALTHSVETIKVPRDVLVVCIGKSTYARCFTGDTKIKLADGTSPTFLEMIERSEKGERFWGYSIADNMKIVMSELIAPRKIGTESVLEVELDDGSVISCTPDHKFIMRDGREVEAQHLKENDSLYPLYIVEARGYYSILQPCSWIFEAIHRLADAWNEKNNMITTKIVNYHRHHVDGNKANNIPSNIIRVDAGEHIRHHNKERFMDEEYRLKISNIHKRRWENLPQVQKDKEISRLRIMNKELFSRNDISDIIRRNTDKLLKFYETEKGKLLKKKQSERARVYWGSLEKKLALSERAVLLWKNPEYRKLMTLNAATINRRDDITEDKIREALEQEGSIRGAARSLKIDRSVFRRFKHIIFEYKEKWEAAKIKGEVFYSKLMELGGITKTAKFFNLSRNYCANHFSKELELFYGTKVANNHKVKSIRKTDRVEDVYCLTCPEYGNFALDAGVFVNNCGVVVNVTPLEPEWEGQITLELSNTTNLPLEIFVNEGIAQLLFFKADKTCLTSYKDRNGKYQNQIGIVNPKV